MSVWYAILNALGLPMFEMDFMKNALLAVLLPSPRRAGGCLPT